MKYLRTKKHTRLNKAQHKVNYILRKIRSGLDKTRNALDCMHFVQLKAQNVEVWLNHLLLRDKRLCCMYVIIVY